MDNVRLYVYVGTEWLEADLQGGDLVTLNKRVAYAEVGETSFRQGEYSETFLLPETTKNKAIFKAYFKAHGSNSSTVFPAMIYSNSYLISRGEILIDSVIFENSIGNLRVNFVGQDVAFFNTLTDPLTDLDFSELDNLFTASLSNVDTFTSGQRALSAVTTSLADAVKFGYVEYVNNILYEDYNGATFYGYGNINGGQNFYWDGSRRTDGNPVNFKVNGLTTPGFTSFDTCYGKAGFYLGWNYNPYFTHTYLTKKVIEDAGYTWSTPSSIPSESSFRNTQLIYKDWTKPGTNQYWYKQKTDTSSSIVEIDRYWDTTAITYLNNVEDGPPPTLVSGSTGSLELRNSNGTVVASQSIYFNNTFRNSNFTAGPPAGNDQIKDTTVIYTSTGSWYFNMNGLPADNYSIWFNNYFIFESGFDGNNPSIKYEPDLLVTAPIDPFYLNTNYRSGSQYFMNLLPDDYISQGTFFYDGQPNVAWEYAYRFDFRVFSDLLNAGGIPPSSLASPRGPLAANIRFFAGPSRLQFAVPKNKNRINYPSMLPGWTKGQFLSEMIKLHNLYFDIDEGAKSIRIAPYLSYYRNFNPTGSTTVLDLNKYINTLESIEVGLTYPYDTWQFQFNLNTSLPYYSTWQGQENPSFREVQLNQKATNTFNINLDSTEVLMTPAQDILAGFITGSSGSFTYPNPLPVLNLGSQGEDVTVGSVIPYREISPATTLVENGRPIEYNFNPLIDISALTTTSDLKLYGDTAFVLFLSYTSQSDALGGQENSSYTYVQSRDVCPFTSTGNDYPKVKFASFGKVYQPSNTYRILDYNLNTGSINSNFRMLNPQTTTFVYTTASVDYDRYTTYYKDGNTVSGSVYWMPTKDLVQSNFGEQLGLFLPTDMTKFRRIKLTAALPDSVIAKINTNTLISLNLWDSEMLYSINTFEVNLDGQNTCVLDLFQYNYG